MDSQNNFNFYNGNEEQSSLEIRIEEYLRNNFQLNGVPSQIAHNQEQSNHLINEDNISVITNPSLLSPSSSALTSFTKNIISNNLQITNASFSSNTEENRTQAIIVDNIIQLDHKHASNEMENKKKGPKPDGSTEKGVHTWKDPGNIRTKIITTFMDIVFNLVQGICLVYGFKLKRPNSGKLFGKNKKMQKQFISKKIYQILCTKPGNKDIIMEMIKRNESFKNMVNCRVDQLYENKYIKDENTICLDEILIPDGFEGLSLKKGLEAKKKKMEAKNEKLSNKHMMIKYTEEEIEEIIESLKKYSIKLIQDINEEKDYIERKGKEPEFEYELIPEIEN